VKRASRGAGGPDAFEDDLLCGVELIDVG